MNTSPQKRSTSTTFVGPLLGHKIFSLARSHFPANTQAHYYHRRLGVAPIPFAPLIDTHVFEPPPPPYSAYPYPRLYESRECLPVPHNTPERAPTPTAVGVGLGLSGVERGNGERFDGLGELSGGFRGSVESGGMGTREQVHRMLTKGSRRRRTWASEPPAMQHDVFYASVEVDTCETTGVFAKKGTSMKIRIRRQSVGSPTPGLKRTNKDKQK